MDNNNEIKSAGLTETPLAKIEGSLPTGAKQTIREVINAIKNNKLNPDNESIKKYLANTNLGDTQLTLDECEAVAKVIDSIYRGIQTFSDKVRSLGRSLGTSTQDSIVSNLNDALLAFGRDDNLNKSLAVLFAVFELLEVQE